MSGNTSATGGVLLSQPPLPPTSDDIQAALQQLVAGLAQLPGSLVRPRWQPMPPSQPDPGTSWASIGVTMVEADEYPALLHVDATLTGQSYPGYSIMQRHETLTVVLTCYGPQAEEIAASVRDGLYVNQNLESLLGVGAKLRTVEDLARAPELINQQYIDRVDLRMLIRRQIERVYPILNLDGADVDLTTDGGVDATASVRGAA